MNGTRRPPSYTVFAAGKGHAVIAGKENQRAPLAVFLEDLHQPVEPLVHARGALVILREFGARPRRNGGTVTLAGS